MEVGYINRMSVKVYCSEYGNTRIMGQYGKMNKQGCKVSIITVSYNSVKTIEQTIQSVLKQSYNNIEYIVIDGASTDGTQQIIEKYTDNIAYYVSEKDDGLFYAMNKGIERATGDIIGIINSDDWYARDAIENMVIYMQESDVELAYGKVINIYQDGKKEVVGYIPLEKIWYLPVIHHPSVFVKRNIYSRYGMFNTDYEVFSDYDLELRFYSEKVRFGFLDKVIAYFRIGGLSTIKQYKACDEIYPISMAHINKCPIRDNIESFIYQGYEWMILIKKIVTERGALSELLLEYFHKKIDKIVIWGTGIWGERCYTALAQTDIIVTNFADNNPSKWNTEFKGIRVINPNDLKDMVVYVLIAVREYGEEIRTQLNNISNTGISCVTINDLKEINSALYNDLGDKRSFF